METKYKISFTGRLSGAIGITYRIQKDITAPTINKAIEILYRDYEHISDVKINGKKIRLSSIVFNS